MMLPRPAMIARAAPRKRRIALPDVRCDLLWADGVLSIIGPMTSAQSVPSPGTTRLLLSFDPAPAATWLGIPMRELVDCRLPLAQVAPRLARTLTEAFERHAGDAFANVAWANAPAGDRALGFAAAAIGAGARVGWAADAIDLSVRQFERRFEAAVGLPPKLYARILRLRRAVGLATDGATLAAAAAGAGFADQAHFSREVRSLAGVTPTTLLPHVANVQDVVSGHAVSPPAWTDEHSSVQAPARSRRPASTEREPGKRA